MHIRSCFRAGPLAAAFALAAGCATRQPELVQMTGHSSTLVMTNPVVVDLLKAQYPDVPAAEVEEKAEIAGYHDSQRLQTGNASSDFGPLVRMYAGPRARTDAELQAPGGALVAVMEVYGRSQGMAAYARLNIDQNTVSTNLYCVFLEKQSGNWEGSVRPYGVNGCAAASAQYNLQLQRMPNGGTGTEPTPVVARFGDDLVGMPTIGVNCGDGWCEMGRALGGYKAPSTPGNTQQAIVKAWHDEQRLAEPSSATPGSPLKMSATVASVTPVPDLGSKTLNDFAAKNAQGDYIGTRVGTIQLAGALPSGSKYAAWGLVGNGLTDVYIRNAGGVWGAQFVVAGTMPDPSGRWFRVNRTEHSFRPPGVARWSWDERDEESWFACEQGCCEIGSSPITFIGRQMLTPFKD